MADSDSALSVTAEIAAIEDALVAQWSTFGLAPGGAWHEADDLVWSEAPLRQLPYNAVLRTRLGADADERIERVIRHFRERNVQFMWLLPPSATPHDLSARLEASGLSLVESVTGMSLDLAAWQDPGPQEGPIAYRRVSTTSDLDAYDELLAEYWELPEDSRAFPLGVSRWAHATNVPGARWVALSDGVPVGKAYLSLKMAGDTAAIFGVYVRAAARGQGVARRLNELAIRHAVDLGLKRVVLHSSAMAVNVYKRLGFVDLCSIPVYATASLHGAQPI